MDGDDDTPDGVAAPVTVDKDDDVGELCRWRHAQHQWHGGAIGQRRRDWDDDDGGDGGATIVCT